MTTENNEKKLDIQRQAIIVIHGIGEQKPMDTLRDFGELIAPEISPKKDKDGNALLQKKKFFNKPDVLSETYELRRLTANEHRHSFKTDYFEYYWAHKMSGTKIWDIVWWIKALLFRKPSAIPKRILWIYLFFWLSVLLAVAIVAISSLGLFQESLLSDWLKTIRNALSSAWIKYGLSSLWLIVSFFLVYYLGDAARYMTPRTGNIKQRQDIRKTGIELLKKLHEAKISVIDKDGKPLIRNKYDRIILVGHSLGSVIAYDLIKFLWTHHHEQISLSKKAINAIEDLAYALNESKEDSTIGKNRKAFREKQFQLWKNQHADLNSWRISDFITLGSPLAHAELLLARNPDELKQKKEEREFPTCPPTPETDKDFHFSMEGKYFFHHASPFVLTRWTNFYYTKDYVGGAIECFGKGIENHELKSDSWFRNLIPFISHIFYWHAKEPNAVKRIREKLQLRIPTTNPKAD